MYPCRFNLRDLSRVYEGLCNATIDVVTTSSQMVRLWRNECDRIFYDRLTTTNDQDLFTTESQNIIKETFPDCYDHAIKQPCLFGDFEQAYHRIESEGESEDSKLYKDLGEYDNVREIFGGILDLYNMKNKEMTLVLFEQALEHLCRIHRILRTPRGNALLVGVGGSGKQSLTKLATFVAGKRRIKRLMWSSWLYGRRFRGLLHCLLGFMLIYFVCRLQTISNHSVKRIWRGTIQRRYQRIVQTTWDG